jgi:hypothetical protein
MCTCYRIACVAVLLYSTILQGQSADGQRSSPDLITGLLKLPAPPPAAGIPGEELPQGNLYHLTYAQNSALWGDCLLNFGPLVSARSGSGRRLRIFRSKLQCFAGCCRCKCLFFLGWSCIGFYAESQPEKSQPESGVASTGKKPAGPFVISRSRFIKR